MFAVVIPTRIKETALRCPAHGKELSAIEHPIEIHIAVDLCGQFLNFSVREIGAASQHATKKQSRINRRDFRVEGACSRSRIHEMEEKSVLSTGLHRVCQEVECGLHSAHNCGMRLIATLIPDAKRSEPKACGRNTRNCP